MHFSTRDGGMEDNNMTENKKGFLKDDRLLVCSMLVFYGICIIGLVAITFWRLNSLRETTSANATATAVSVATQQASSTSTAIAHSTELAQYEVIDPFDSTINEWQHGPMLGGDWEGSLHINSGVYSWDIDDVYHDYSMISVEFIPGNHFVKNYDTYVDTKFAKVPSGTACSGLMFRRSPLSWNTGGYSFVICNVGYFSIHYHNAKDGWQEIKSQYHPLIQLSDWNRLEVLVNGSHFVFLINGQIVYETDDDRQPVGGVSLMIEVQVDETQILFDNFGYQTR